MGSFVLEVVGNVYFIKIFFPVSIWEIGRASVAFETLLDFNGKGYFLVCYFRNFFRLDSIVAYFIWTESER